MLALEMWGGVECTVNRVGDDWHDQLRASGHDVRIQDLTRFAQLGLKRLRYPALWETVAPDAPDRFDWRWLDQRVARLQELALEPILGLLHHGSGPRYTSLLDERFPDWFAEYAFAVACRFPWVAHYTPINEPLTTARFSALYGHWYPHRRDDRSFARALVNQVRATTLAMQAIRRVNSSAQLIQTDDLGRTTSTSKLSYQADFDNERRWLGWDLLRGAVDRQHALWPYLRKAGIAASELDWLIDHACPPDIIGQRSGLVRGRRGSPRIWQWTCGHRRSARRCLDALSLPGGDHRSASGMHARRSVALAALDLAIGAGSTRCGHRCPRRNCVGPAGQLRLGQPGDARPTALRGRSVRCSRTGATRDRHRSSHQ
jgi:hypothetical protein